MPPSSLAWPTNLIAATDALVALRSVQAQQDREARRIRTAAARGEAKLAATWSAIFATLRPERRMVLEAIRTSDPALLLAALWRGTTRMALAQPVLAAQLQATYVRGLAVTVELAAIAPLTTAADVPTNLYTEAAEWADAAAATLVSNITEETRAGIRRLVAEAFLEGVPPRDLARLILTGTPLGLTAPQMGALLRLRRRLTDLAPDRVAWNGARRIVAPEGGLPFEQVTNEVGRAAARMLRQRALTIARTETIHAARMGQQALWRHYRGLGYLDGRAQQVWSAAPDERTCPICRDLDGQRADLDDPIWTTITGGEVTGPPAHPMCRCSLVLAT